MSLHREVRAAHLSGAARPWEAQAVQWVCSSAGPFLLKWEMKLACEGTAVELKGE